jgi:PKD repeat protein
MLLLSTGLSFAQTNVPAVISSSQTWTKANSPYTINQNSVISSGVVVTIEPGVVVRSPKSYELTVNGSIEAKGSQTLGMVKFDSVQIKIVNSGVDYNSSTGVGNQFNWCRFTGPLNGSSATAVKSTMTSIMVDRCMFIGYYKAVDMQGGNNDSLWVTNTYFSQNNAVRGFGTTLITVVKNNSFYNCGDLYFYGPLVFERNFVQGLKSFASFAYESVDVHCNTFSKVQGPLAFTFYGTGKLQHFSFTNNDLDSFSKQMVTINRENFIDKAKFSRNNFLHTDGNTKVAVSGANSDQSTSTRIDFTGNYWGVTSPNQIEDMVSDYGDNIQIFGKVDYSSFATAKIVKDCPSCVATFSITPDSSDRKTYNLVGSAPPYRGYAKYRVYNNSGVSYTELSGSSVNHKFSANVTNNRIVYIVYDSTGSICDSSSQRISCMASYYIGRDTANKFKLFLINNSRGTDNNTSYLWSFGDGTTSTKKSPNHKYTKFGKYEVCLSIANTLTGCESRFCDSIGLDSNGNLLKAEGFELVAVEEEDLLQVASIPSDVLVKVYPNPTQGVLTVEVNELFTETAVIRVVNSFGQKVVETSTEGSVAIIDLSTEASGMYFVQIASEGRLITKRIVLTN